MRMAGTASAGTLEYTEYTAKGGQLCVLASYLYVKTGALIQTRKQVLRLPVSNSHRLILWRRQDVDNQQAPSADMSCLRVSWPCLSLSICKRACISCSLLMAQTVTETEDPPVESLVRCAGWRCVQFKQRVKALRLSSR